MGWRPTEVLLDEGHSIKKIGGSHRFKGCRGGYGLGLGDI